MTVATVYNDNIDSRFGMLCFNFPDIFNTIHNFSDPIKQLMGRVKINSYYIRVTVIIILYGDLFNFASYVIFLCSLLLSFCFRKYANHWHVGFLSKFMITTCCLASVYCVGFPSPNVNPLQINELYYLNMN